MNCLLTISLYSPDQLLKDLFIAQYRYYSSTSSLFAKASSPAEANASSGSSSSLLSSIIVVMFVSFWAVFWLGKQITNYKTLPKAQRTRGLSSSCQINSWVHITSSNTNLDHISSSESRLSIKNLNQTSASPLNLKFKILTKPSFRISTKIQTPASKSCLNFNFKILTNPCAQGLKKS